MRKLPFKKHRWTVTFSSKSSEEVRKRAKLEKVSGAEWIRNACNEKLGVNGKMETKQT